MEQMDAEFCDTLVIGAGPAGLTAALELCRGGTRPLVLERGDHVGGMMHSPRWGDFITDLGRKELYSRFPEIDALWRDMLGEDYRPYEHRVGSLFRGRVVELSGHYRGPLRGMPAHWLAAGGLDLLRSWVVAAARRPRTYEEYWRGRVGGVFSRILAQGYWEKFRGRAWANMPPPETNIDTLGWRPRSFDTVRQALALARHGGVATQAVWRHPACGTGQLFERLAEEVRRLGGRIQFRAEATAIHPHPRADGSVEVLTVEDGVGRRRLARRVVSSMHVERLWEMLSPNRADRSCNLDLPVPDVERCVLLTYLFFDEPPRFPHVWLEVNDPHLASGRITNYAAFGGKMVPPGCTALCVEFFCDVSSPLVELDDDALIGLAETEIASVGLLNPNRLIGSRVLRLRRTNAAESWREQKSEYQAVLLRRVSEFPTIYHINRPGSDWASLAGLMAARAILSGDRAAFDLNAEIPLAETRRVKRNKPAAMENSFASPRTHQRSTPASTPSQTRLR